MRGQLSASLKVAKAFVNGIVEETGATVTEIHLREKHIEPCHGCFVCWKATPGQCVIKDDMDEIRDLIMEHDIIVEAFPLYFFNLPSKLKAFTDRMVSYVQEYRASNGDEEGNRFLHNMRYPELNEKKLVLVSTCGYETTEDNYDSVFVMFDKICGKGHYTTVLAPQGGVISEKSLENKVNRYLVKFTDAGKEFAINGKISDETWEKLQVPMLGHNTFDKIINMNWDNQDMGPYGKPV